MSLVGPRPPLPAEVAGYDDTAHRRLRLRPGLTGLWQVSGRSDLSWEDSLRLDLRYVDNWSMALDLQILARTVRAVTHGAGASQTVQVPLTDQLEDPLSDVSDGPGSPSFYE